MKVLFIGGTGTISLAVAQHAAQTGAEVTLLNRGNHPELLPDGAKLLRADINDVETVKRQLSGQAFDAVADFNVFTPQQAQRDISLFSGYANQYLFISSASVYQKSPSSCPITESTPLINPYWSYSRDKIDCEELFLAAYRSAGFPATIVRPSYTYGNRRIPIAVHGQKGSWQVIERMLNGKPILVHGDGLTLWTFTHNTDFAKGFCGLMGNPHAIGQAVHITGDEVLTWNDAYEIIGRAFGVKPNLVHVPSDVLAAYDPSLLGTLLGDKSNCMIFDNSKLKRLVPGFCASVRFSEGIRRAAEYILSHSDCRIADPEFDAWCDKVIAAHFSQLKESV